MMTNFCDLPHALLTEIAMRIKNLEDYTSFRCVSKSLCSSAKEEYFEGLRLRQHTPYMMLSVREGNDDTREIYSLVENESVVASVKVPNIKTKKCLESLGWLLVSDIGGSSCLLNPFSGIEIPVPHQNTFPEYDEVEMDGHKFFEKMVLSSRPNESSDFVLMVIGGDKREVAYWRLGNEAWTKINRREGDGDFKDVVHYGGGQFYAFVEPGRVYVFNFSRSDNQIVAEGRIVLSLIPPYVIPNSPDEYSEIVRSNRIYLLKSNDDSLLLIKRSSPLLASVNKSYITKKFQVYDLDVVRGTWKEIYSLGSMAVFLGHNSTTFVDASRQSGVVKPNHIYFTDDNWKFYANAYAYRGLGGGYDSGVYNFETGTVEPVNTGERLLNHISPSFWITPSF